MEPRIRFQGMNSASVPSPHRLFKNTSSGYIGWRNSFLGINSWAPQTFKNTGSETQSLRVWEISGVGGGRGRGEEGGRKGGAEGDRGWDDLSFRISGAHVQHMCPKESRNHTILAYLGGSAGCVYSSKSIERSSTILENYSARSSPSLCEIWKALSISKFEHESQKKARRCRGLALDPCLDSSIRHSSNSFEAIGLFVLAGLLLYVGK
jgi:hypothetical protein